MRFTAGRRLMAVAMAAVTVMMTAATAAVAETRLALVIANQGYTQTNARLSSTFAAGDIAAAAFEKAGYRVTVVRDTRLDGALRKAITDHVERVKSAGAGSTGVIYFVGHAASDRPDGDVFLVPTDVPIESGARLSWASVSVGSIGDLVAKSSTAMTLIVDGCRGLFVDRNATPADPSADKSGCGTPQVRAGLVVTVVKKPGGASIVERFVMRGRDLLFARGVAAGLAKPDARLAEVLETAATDIARETKGAQTALGSAPRTLTRTSLPPDQSKKSADDYAKRRAEAEADRPQAAAPPPPPPVADAPSPARPAMAKAPPPGTRGLAAAPADWDVVPVYYGTNRKAETNVKRASYSADRTASLDLGRALVTVPRAHKVPNLERPWVYKVPFTQVVIYGEPEDPAKHFTLKEVRSLPEDEWLQLVRERLAASKTYERHALIFVHGFNTTFDHALFRTAQIAYDLKFDGAPFVYSWPSKGELNQTAYNFDRESAESARPNLKGFIELVVAKTGATRVSIIAHSMGHQVLMPVLDELKRSKPKGAVISEVILAAPDMERSQFETIARQLNGFSGMTLYASANDVALKAAERYWGAGRAGGVPAQGPVVVGGLDTIDVSSTSTDWFGLNHSTYAERTELIDDIGKLLRARIRQSPPQRDAAFVEASSGGGIYWKFPPRAPTAGAANAAPVKP